MEKEKDTLDVTAKLNHSATLTFFEKFLPLHDPDKTQIKKVPQVMKYCWFAKARPQSQFPANFGCKMLLKHPPQKYPPSLRDFSKVDIDF